MATPVAALGLTPVDDSVSALSGDSAYSDAELYAAREQLELLGVDTYANTADSAELLILTQGALLNLADYGDGVIAPRQEDDGSTIPADVGVYAISYGKGEQQVGNAYIQFAYDEFTTGSELYATVSFTNVGDAAIRGSEDQPITVSLMRGGVNGEQPMKTWWIRQNITAGQTVYLATDQQLCTALTQDLGTGDYFYITVEEDADYISSLGGTAYVYNSSTETKESCHYVYRVESKPELGVEGAAGQHRRRRAGWPHCGGPVLRCDQPRSRVGEGRVCPVYLPQRL